MISHIVAMSKNRVLGNKGKVPWHITEDLIRTKNITMGHPLIMGRKTHESIAGFTPGEGWTEDEQKPKLKALPGRTNIVVTRQNEYISPDSVVVKSIEGAIETAKKSEGSEEIFIFGGQELFIQTMDIVDKIYLTVIEAEVEGDSFYPEIDESKFKMDKNIKRIVRLNEVEIIYYFQEWIKI